MTRTIEQRAGTNTCTGEFCQWPPLCRYCDLPIVGAVPALTFAYWQVYGTRHQPAYPCHATCRQEGERAEAYECQCLDADCNDCAYFQRGAHRGERLFPSPTAKVLLSADHPGHCLKLDKPVAAHPNFASLLPCFEHRRASSRAAGTIRQPNNQPHH